MKIIHTGDLHLESSLTTHLSSIKANERKKELINSFERMVNFASLNNVRVIIISGDMFDKKRVSITAKRKVFDIIKNNNDIDFLYISGNHDDIDLSYEQVPENLKLFSNKWEKYSYENIDIYGINFTKSSNKYLYDTLITKQDRINIVTIHGQIVNHISNEDININLLKDKNIDYLALGHIHKYQCEKLDDRGIYCYCGCLEARGFDEDGEKGFVLLDIENGKITTKFIKNAYRNVYKVEVDITNVFSWIDLKNKVNELVSNIDSKDMVKVILKGQFEITQIKYNEQLLDYLLSKFYFAKVDDESKLKIDISNFENEISLKGEFLREVKNSNLEDSLKDEVILCGIKALTGEDLS